MPGRPGRCGQTPACSSGTDDLRLPREHRVPGRVERDREPHGTVPLDSVGGLDMHVGLAAVPRIPAGRDRLAAMDHVPRADGQRSLLKVGDQDERPVPTDPDHDVVAGNPGRSCPETPRLSQCIGDECELGASGPVVRPPPLKATMLRPTHKPDKLAPSGSSSTTSVGRHYSPHTAPARKSA